MAIEHLWDHGSSTPTLENHDASAFTAGNVFQFASSGTITSVWWYRYADDTRTSLTGRVWSNGGGALASGTQSGLSGSGWKEIPLSAPLTVAAGTQYVVSVDLPTPGHNGQYSSLGVAGLTNGNVSAPSSAVVNPGDQGRYAAGVNTYPSSNDANHGYGVDVSYEADPPPAEPWIVAADCTNSGNDTASTSWAVSYPAYAVGDLLIFHIVSDANVTHDWPSTGPLGETINTLQDSYGPDASSNQRVSGFWFVGTGTKTAATLTVTPSATEQWTGTVVKMAAGRFNATTPITNGGVSSDDADVTNMPSPAWTAPATAGALPVVWYGIDTDPLVSAASGWVAQANVDRGAVSGVLGVRTAKTTASESVASVNFTTTADSFAAFSYVINPPAASVSAITTAAAVRALGVVPVATVTAHVSALTLAHAPVRALGVVPVATASAHVSATTTAAAARALGFVPVAATTVHVEALATAAAARALGVVPVATVTAHVSATTTSAAARALGVVPVASTTAHVSALTDAAAARALGAVPVAAATANVAATTTAAAARALGAVPVATTTAHVSAITTAAAARALGLVPVAAAGANVSALALAAAPIRALGEVPVATRTAHVSSTTTAAPARALGLVPVAVATTFGAFVGAVRWYATIVGSEAFAGSGAVSAVGFVPVATRTTHVSAIPAAAAARALGQVPVANASAHVSALPAAAAARALGAVPIAFASQGTQALAGQARVVGFVPVAAATAHVAAIATAAAARALGQTPTASSTANVAAPALAGTARALGVEPIAYASQGTQALAGQVRIIGLVPVAAVTAHVSAIAGAGAIRALGVEPVAVAGDVKVALAAAGAAQAAGSVPEAVASDHKAATAGAGSAAAVGSLPLAAVTLGAFAFPEGGVARVVGPIPYVLAGREAEAFPEPGVIRALGENVVAFARPQRPTLPSAERPGAAGGSARRPVVSGGSRSNAALAVRPPALDE